MCDAKIDPYVHACSYIHACIHTYIHMHVQGTLSLRHNAANIFRVQIGTGDRLSEALQHLAEVGKQRANHRITGFIKVVDNATLDDMPLSLLLENALCKQ